MDYIKNSFFDAMQKEALFTGEMLCAGYSQIRKANYANRGIYFQAFTSLSTGFERIGKICYLLIFAIENNGRLPTYEHLKKDVGHDIFKLYKKIVEFKRIHNFQYSFLQHLDNPIYYNILKLLSEFGKGDRYANIDSLLKHVSCKDPISTWYKKVDLTIFDEIIPEKKKERIYLNASIVHNLISDFTIIQHTGEDGKEINQVFDGSYRSGLNEAVSPYRQLFIFHIIRFFIESLYAIEKIVLDRNLLEIPCFDSVKICSQFCF